MATLVWQGDAPAVAQVTTCTIGGTLEVGDLLKITIGGVTFTHAATSATLATAASALVTAFNALSGATYPQFNGTVNGITAAATGGGAFTLTADTAGKPFTVVLETTEANGDPADDQTFTQAATTASAGPNHWDTAANWDTGTVPVDGDTVVIENSSVDILYGLDQSSVELAALIIKQSYTGRIGLPRTNSLDSATFVEYLPQYLQLEAAALTIGEGEGSGSGRIKINLDAGVCTANIYNSGSPVESGLKSILLTGLAATSVVNINKGSLGVSLFSGETAEITTLRMAYQSSQSSDADVRLGSGVTLTTIAKHGGKLEINSSVTTLTQSAGETTIVAGTPTTINLTGGKLNYRTSAGYTTLNVSDGGEFDCRGDLRTKAAGTTNLYKGAKFYDPFEVLTSLAIAFKFCTEADCTLMLGNDITLTRS